MMCRSIIMFAYLCTLLVSATQVVTVEASDVPFVDATDHVVNLRGTSHAVAADLDKKRHLVTSTELTASKPIVELQKRGNGSTVTVKVHQHLIGNSFNCKQNAKFFSMIYKDADTGEDTCILERDVNPCTYQKYLVLPCNASTGLASLDVYAVLDETGTYDIWDTVVNPQIGLCFSNYRISETLPRSGKRTFTFQCDVDTDFDLIYEKDYPSSCESVLRNDYTSLDGEYAIYKNERVEGGAVEHTPLDVYCHGMSGLQHGGPKEYITLYSLDRNYSIYAIGRQSQNYEGGYLLSVFKKVRFDPKTFKVDVADYTFAYSRGYVQTNDGTIVSSFPYATVYNCRRFWKEAIRIQFSGTMYDIANVRDFSLGGEERGWFGFLNYRFGYGLGAERCSWVNPGPSIDEPINLPEGSYLLQLKLRDRWS